METTEINGDFKHLVEIAKELGDGQYWCGWWKGYLDIGVTDDDTFTMQWYRYKDGSVYGASDLPCHVEINVSKADLFGYHYPYRGMTLVTKEPDKRDILFFLEEKLNRARRKNIKVR